MSKFRFSKRSLLRLVDVEPRLVAVMKRALELSPYDFGISEGSRTRAIQQERINSGASRIMNSLHLIQKDGYAHAVDFYVLDENGKVTWEQPYYRKVIQAVFTAAIEQGVQVESGGLWKSVFDGPHVQLNQDYL